VKRAQPAWFDKRGRPTEACRADLDRLWRGSESFVGPVAPPMVLALRRPGYLASLTAAVARPQPIGHQYAFAL